MFKTDISKAYDSVSWKYLDTMMEAMNFGEKWRNWIHACLASSAMSVLVNGSPTFEFVMERGLRQGDPISPFLFTLIMEGLSLAVNKAVENGMFKDLKVGKDNISVSHLFFADDAVFLGEWTLDNAICMINVLMCFRRASSLRVNYQKSSLFGIGVDTDSISSMANLLGCKADKLPEIFLGGRLTIVCNILGGIPNYWLSMFPMPKGAIKKLENMRQDFFWGPKEAGRPIPWVKWSKACQQRKNGGLGIIGIEEMNLYLLAKWVWRFKKEDNATWVKIVQSIHRKKVCMGEEDMKKMHSCSWKNILLKLKNLDSVHLNFPYLLQVNLGNGEDTEFWEDKWHETGDLKRNFPRMYALEDDKKVKVKDRINTRMEYWNRRRAFRDGREREEAVKIQELCNSKTLSNAKDSWMVDGAPNGEFSTDWFRDCIESRKVMGQVQQNYWIKWVPKKHNVFIWRAILDRIPTRKNLSEKGVDIPYWWKLKPPEFQDLEDPLKWAWFATKNKKTNGWLQVAIIAVLTSIWKIRNRVVFDKKKVVVDFEFKKSHELAFQWLSSRNSKFKLDLCNWVSNPSNNTCEAVKKSKFSMSSCSVENQNPNHSSPLNWSNLWSKNKKALDHVVSSAIRRRSFYRKPPPTPQSPPPRPPPPQQPPQEVTVVPPPPHFQQTQNNETVPPDSAEVVPSHDFISLLSDETLLQILSKFPDQSQKNSNSLVSKSWLNLQGRLVKSIRVFDWNFLTSGHMFTRFPNLIDIDLLHGSVTSSSHTKSWGLSLGREFGPFCIDSDVFSPNNRTLRPVNEVDSGLKLLATAYPNLQRLVVVNCTEIGLLNLAEGCPNLQEMVLHHCHDQVLRGIADIGLTILAQGCKRLVKLELRGCEGSYDGIRAIGQCCQMLEELTFSDHRMDPGWLSALSYCENMKILKLVSCKTIDQSPGLDEHLGSCKLLERLQLERCRLSEKQSLRALFLVCQSVREMVVKDCWGLKDGIFLNANLCRRVKLLWIEGCSRLTTEGLEAVVLDLNELESLRVISCKNMKDNRSLISGSGMGKRGGSSDRWFWWSAFNSPQLHAFRGTMKKDKSVVTESPSGSGITISSSSNRLFFREEEESERKQTIYDFPLPIVTRNGSSKYDFVKVKVWLGDNADHYYVLSRFLLSRMLTVTKIPNHTALKIALELKKLLVDNSLLDVSQSDLETNLFKLMKWRGYGQKYINRYRMMTRFHHQRVPLVILVCGTACVGKSTIATQLAQRLNLPNVLQTDMVYELLRTSTDAPLASSPLLARDFSSSDELITEFCRECRIVRKGLAGDLKKAMKDGKPIIIEGMHVDPSIYLIDDGNTNKNAEKMNNDPENVPENIMINSMKDEAPDPVVIPVVLKMAEFDHKALLEEWISTRKFSRYPIKDKDKLISNLNTIQDYLCSFTSQGSEVANISATTFPQTLDWLHNHLLQRIEQGISSASKGSGDVDES
ncbi:hypothetical protein LXL04_035339 [Taraxacum kok-saghyz]